MVKEPDHDSVTDHSSKADQSQKAEQAHDAKQAQEAEYAQEAEHTRKNAKRWAYLVTGVVAVTVAAPMWIPDAKDSFPLSTYPMFARKRGKPRMYQLVGKTESGTFQKLSPELLGTSEVLQAKVLIRRAARAGKKEQRKLCRQVAKNIVGRSQVKTELRQVQEVHLLRVRFDPIGYFTESPEPIEQKRLTRCRVGWDQT